MAKATGDPHDLPDPDLKIILLGDSAVGKSKLIERYLMDEFNPRQVCTPCTRCKYNAIDNICAAINVRIDIISKGSEDK